MICFSAKPRFASLYECHLLRLYRLLILQGYTYTVMQVDALEGNGVDAG